MMLTIELTAEMYEKARNLMRHADDDGCDIHGRVLKLTGTLGTFYGASLVADQRGELELKLTCKQDVHYD